MSGGSRALLGPGLRPGPTHPKSDHTDRKLTNTLGAVPNRRCFRWLLC